MELKINKPITREMQLRAISEEMIQNRQAEFVISTETPDTYNTVFRADGWDLSRYKNNPIVLYAHRSFGGDPDHIIGVGEVYREDNNLIGKVTFETEDVNPLAEKVFKKVQNGTLRMASIGANPIEGHWGKKEANEDPEILYFDRQELLEFSIVPLGSNPDALKRNAESIAQIKESIKKHNRTLPQVKISADALVKVIKRRNHGNIEVTQPETVVENKQLLSIREAQLIINKSKNVQK